MCFEVLCGVVGFRSGVLITVKQKDKLVIKLACIFPINILPTVQRRHSVVVRQCYMSLCPPLHVAMSSCLWFLAM